MSRIYKNKMQYIGALKACLSAKDDFADLKYCRNSQGEEYLILSDIIGQVIMLSVTGLSEAQMFRTIAVVECGATPKNAVTDYSKRLEIAKLICK